MGKTTIGDIITVILGAFKVNAPPAEPLPPPLVLTGGNIRPGISARKVASRILTRQSEAGAPVGSAPDGSDNISEAMEVIRVEEITNAILTEAKVQVALAPGIPIQSIGIGNLGAPVAAQGVTSGIASGTAIIS